MCQFWSFFTKSEPRVHKKKNVVLHRYTQYYLKLGYFGKLPTWSFSHQTWGAQTLVKTPRPLPPQAAHRDLGAFFPPGEKWPYRNSTEFDVFWKTVCTKFSRNFPGIFPGGLGGVKSTKIFNVRTQNRGFDHIFKTDRPEHSPEFPGKIPRNSRKFWPKVTKFTHGVHTVHTSKTRSRNIILH